MSAVITYHNPFAEDIYGRVPRMLTLFKKQAEEVLPTVHPVDTSRSLRTRMTDWTNRAMTTRPYVGAEFRHPEHQSLTSHDYMLGPVSEVGGSMMHNHAQNIATNYIGSLGTWDRLRFGISTILGRIWDWIQKRVAPESKRPNPFTGPTSFVQQHINAIKMKTLESLGVDTTNIDSAILSQIDTSSNESLTASLEATGLKQPVQSNIESRAQLIEPAAHDILATDFGGDEQKYNAYIAGLPPDAWVQQKLERANNPEFLQRYNENAQAYQRKPGWFARMGEIFAHSPAVGYGLHGSSDPSVPIQHTSQVRTRTDHTNEAANLQPLKTEKAPGMVTTTLFGAPKSKQPTAEPTPTP